VELQKLMQDRVLFGVQQKRENHSLLCRLHGDIVFVDTSDEFHQDCTHITHCKIPRRLVVQGRLAVGYQFFEQVHGLVLENNKFASQYSGCGCLFCQIGIEAGRYKLCVHFESAQSDLARD